MLDHDRPVQPAPDQERPVQLPPDHERPDHERPDQERPDHERPDHDVPDHERPDHERPVHDSLVQDAPVQSAPAPVAWEAAPLRSRWLADPLVLDASFQLMILWTVAERGAASLPTHVRAYRQYRVSFPASGVEVAFHSSPGAGHTITPDGLDFAMGFLRRLAAAREGPET